MRNRKEGIGLKRIKLLLLLVAGATVVTGASVALAAKIDPPQKATLPADSATSRRSAHWARSTGH